MLLFKQGLVFSIRNIHSVQNCHEKDDCESNRLSVSKKPIKQGVIANQPEGWFAIT